MNTITGYAMSGIEKANQILTERRAVQGGAGLVEGEDFKWETTQTGHAHAIKKVRLLTKKAQENPLAVVYHYDSFPFGGTWSTSDDLLTIKVYTD